jgi:hypothetical protein
VLLGAGAETSGELLRRCPHLVAALAAGRKVTAPGHGAVPVRLGDRPPAFLAGDLVHSGGAEYLGNGGVGVPVGQRILAREQPAEEPVPHVPVRKLEMPGVTGDGVQVGPRLEHAAGFVIQDVVHGPAVGPPEEPVSGVRHQVEREVAAEVTVRVEQAHQRLVDGVVRRPDGLVLGDPVQVFFRDREDPLATVFPLAFRESLDDRRRPRSEFDIA